MIENLIKLVESHAQELIVNNNAVPNQFNNEAIKASAASIQESLQGALANGKLKEVLALLGNKTDVNGNPVANDIIANLKEKLSAQYGVTGQNAQSIASQLIPQVLGSLVKKTNDPNDKSFDLNGIFNSLTQGKTQGLDLASLVKGLDTDGDGDVDFNDLVNKLTGGQGLGATLGKMVGNLFGSR